MMLITVYESNGWNQKFVVEDRPKEEIDQALCKTQRRLDKLISDSIEEIELLKQSGCVFDPGRDANPNDFDINGVLIDTFKECGIVARAIDPMNDINYHYQFNQ